MATWDDLGVVSLASRPRSRSRPPPRMPANTNQPVQQSAIKKRREPQPEFPDFRQLEVLAERLPLEKFKWAQKVVRGSGASTLGPGHFLEREPVQFMSEFSGSGCAEVALMSVLRSLGHQGQLSVRSCADIDPQCRTVLKASCALATLGHRCFR